MKVLIAMDSFKGTFSSLSVANMIENGLKRVYKIAVVDKISIADGGEGTVEAIIQSMEGKYVFTKVLDPLGNQIDARYGIVNETVAVIEMAEASGLSLIPEKNRNPLATSSYGTGQLILHALNKGCKKIIMGIGGSATNDGGVGMATALGAKFLDEKGKELKYGGGVLDKLHHIDINNLDERVNGVEFIVACDVNNPLYGENGASKIFAPQKGADLKMVEKLDKNLYHYSNIIEQDLGKKVGNIPGAGAAGGLGAGLMAFCNAKLSRGIDVVLDMLDIDERIKKADIIITGEGRIDSQTVCGKVPIGIAGRAKQFDKPVFAIAGFFGRWLRESV